MESEQKNGLDPQRSGESYQAYVQRIEQYKVERPIAGSADISQQGGGAVRVPYESKADANAGLIDSPDTAATPRQTRQFVSNAQSTKNPSEFNQSLNESPEIEKEPKWIDELGGRSIDEYERFIKARIRHIKVLKGLLGLPLALAKAAQRTEQSGPSVQEEAANLLKGIRMHKGNIPEPEFAPGGNLTQIPEGEYPSARKAAFERIMERHKNRESDEDQKKRIENTAERARQFMTFSDEEPFINRNSTVFTKEGFEKRQPHRNEFNSPVTKAEIKSMPPGEEPVDAVNKKAIDLVQYGFRYLFTEPDISEEEVQSQLLYSNGLVKYGHRCAEVYGRIYATVMFAAGKYVLECRSYYNDAHCISRKRFDNQFVFGLNELDSYTDLQGELLIDTLLALTNEGVFTRYIGESSGKESFTYLFAFNQEDMIFPRPGEFKIN